MAKRPTNKETAGKAPGPVGPGNPPAEHRFRKGVSGNPRGRPRKERDLGKLIEMELDSEVSVAEGGVRRRVTKREIIAKRLVNDAAQGNAKAIAAIAKFIGNSDSSEPANVPVDLEAVTSFLARTFTLPGGAK